MEQWQIDKVRQLETEVLKLPQVKVPTDHVLHAGMYCRTMLVPAGTILTGVLLKVKTILIIEGHFILLVGNKPQEIQGYNIFTGQANRKQAGIAITAANVSMIFPTKAKTIEEAEEEFTDEPHLLFSRYPDADNRITITGD
jgi:hypothetical protein